MSELTGREILLAVTGGIACYRAVEVLRGLKRAGAEVQVVMTANAGEFVRPLTFQTLSNRPVGTGLFELDRESRIGHVAMADVAELALVAPCTANMLAKLRAGICDDLPSTVLLACAAPLYLAPAMNDRMLAHPATRENLAVLEKRGAHVIPSEMGFLAEGREGWGRMADPERIVAAVAAHFAEEAAAVRGPAAGRPLAGRKVLITAGPTVEVIDPVRFISNRSSGRMGFALAEVCRDAGAEVVLVSGPVTLHDPPGVSTRRVNTAEEMAGQVLALQPEQDALMLAAAVADYRMSRVLQHKIKRAGNKTLTLEMEMNRDIATEVGASKKKGQVLVIFAAESQDLIANASRKMEAKQADMVVANDITLPGSGFEGTQNRVTLVRRAAGGNGKPECHDLPLMEKHAVAGHVVDHVVEMLARGE